MENTGGGANDEKGRSTGLGMVTGREDEELNRYEQY